MKIWYQLVSSPVRSSNFLNAVQEHCNAVASPGTEVLVRGTPRGGFADQYSSLLHLDGAEILRLARSGATAESVDVYAMANCLDPAVQGLRELLDVPVLTLMEVGCFVATLMGERFGVIAPNRKMIPTLTNIISGYGYASRLTDMVPLEFGRITDMDALFVDDDFAKSTVEAIETQAAQLVKGGAEVILTPGPIACLVAREGLTSVDGAPVIDMYAALVGFAESVGNLASRGLRTSRLGAYSSPTADQVEQAFETVWPIPEDRSL